MSRGTLATFEDSLERLDVEWTYTDVDGLDATLRDVCSDPTIGTSLGDQNVALPEWIETDPTTDDLRAARTGVTVAGIGIADYGSVVLPTTDRGSEPASLFVDRHVAVLDRSDVVEGMPEAFAWLGETIRDDDATGSAIVATGPSATADMGALVRGAHGPKTVHVVMLDE
jgi:L-lactate dehydrogenase complex protein LldG